MTPCSPQDLIITLLGSYNGCMYLSSRSEACHLLIRTLLDNVEPDLVVTELPTFGQIRHSGVRLSSHSLGLLLTVHLQAIQLLDRVLAVAVKEPFTGEILNSDCFVFWARWILKLFEVLVSNPLSEELC